MNPSGASTPRRRWLDWSGHRWLGLIARLYLGGLFIWASLHKIQHPEAFAIDVATYQLLPLSVLNLFSLTVPWLELVVGILLVIGLRVRVGGLLASLLMVSFMVALGWALAKGLDLSCGCFASQSVREQDPISWRTLVRDSAWLALGLYVTAFDRRPIGIEQFFYRKPSIDPP